jgi:hypothetical protein
MTHQNERFPMPDNQMWFDANNPGALHDALRADFARARAAVERRPSLRRHFTDCSVCQAISAATTDAPAPMAGRNRLKLKVDLPTMHRLLGLPANFEIIHMFADDDPNIVWVKVAGEGLPEVAPTSETPIVTPDAVMRPQA